MTRKYDKIKDAALGDLGSLDQVLLDEFLDEIKNKFQKEKQLIKLPDTELVFVGDTHGDYQSSVQVIDNYFKKDNCLVFLGDYVDRSFEKNGDLRNILYLFYQKYHNENIVMLRGNHEDPNANSHYGFLNSVCDCFNQDTWSKFNDVFSQMPLAAETDKILALHGGLPEIEELIEIEKVPKGLIVEDNNSVLDQILWNDFEERDEEIISTCNRGLDGSICYGKLFFEKQMSKLGKEILIRAHNYNIKGFSKDKRHLTLFTSKTYENKGNIPGRHIAVVKEGNITLEKLE